MAEAARRVVVVGASAAGLRCACRLARLRPRWSVVVVEAREVFSYGACGLPYVLSGDIDDLDALRRTSYGLIRDPEFFATHKGVEVIAGWRAEAVDTAGQELEIVSGGERRVLGYDELVLATGATALTLPGLPEHPRIRTFHVSDDVAPLKRGLVSGEIEQVVVVGAGLVGCELAEAFHSLWGAEVTLVEAAGSVLPTVLEPELAALVRRHLEESGVRVMTGDPVAAIRANEERVEAVVGEERVVANAAVVAVGVRPAVSLARSAGVALGSSGAIAVDERLATSVPHVWAVGDCAECRHAVTGEPAHLPLGSLANRQGRTLANILAGRRDVFPPAAGAAAVKVFDLNVAAVGCSTARARVAGFDATTVWTTVEDRATYWPEVEELFLALVYDRSSERVLGVQAVGNGEAVKRIDLAAQLVARGATLAELVHVEHAYAPAYAPALDPIGVAAAAALNQQEGVVAESPLVELAGRQVLDVRLAVEREAEPVDAAALMEIEMGRLRECLGEISTEPLLVVCERGTRSAEVVRWLIAEGREARYLGGGQAWRRRALPPAC